MHQSQLIPHYFPPINVHLSINHSSPHTTFHQSDNTSEHFPPIRTHLTSLSTNQNSPHTTFHQSDHTSQHFPPTRTYLTSLYTNQNSHHITFHQSLHLNLPTSRLLLILRDCVRHHGCFHLRVIQSVDRRAWGLFLIFDVNY